MSFSTEPDVLVTADDRPRPDARGHRAAHAGGRDGDRRRARRCGPRSSKSSVGAMRRRGRTGRLPAAIVLLSDGAQTRGVLTPLQGADSRESRGHSRLHDRARHDRTARCRFGPFGRLRRLRRRRGRFPVRPDPATLAAIAPRPAARRTGRRPRRRSTRSTRQLGRASLTSDDARGVVVVRRCRAAPARLLGVDRRRRALLRARGSLEVEVQLADGEKTPSLNVG